MAEKETQQQPPPYDQGQQPGYAGQQPPPPGQYQQPGYAGQQPPPPGQYQQAGYAAGPQTVVVQPGAPTHTTIIQQAAPRPSNYLALAIFTTICCNIIFGIIAIVFSVMSSSTADDGDFEGARTKGKISLALSLVGIFSTIIIVVIIVVYFTVVVAAAVNAVTNYG
ncbi:unnamed protein product [Owenia fusiformis]|nr:unnamed protein product [Owenia fusiformis]